jgi:hypothetical protein
MSASNWRKCPRCVSKAKSEHEAKVSAWKESYGKVTAEEYERTRPPLRPKEVTSDTLREDYELWIDDHVDSLAFKMRYRCSCESCGLTYEKNLVERIDDEPRKPN